ncbi:hypothetical protein ACTZWW_18030 [Salinarimonas sp. NSM]|uniref:hypothetical protein n=1 Tax=Salinarimonas sp. NSM TaxID=3458003 RepID=UPI00403505C6
MRVTRISGWWCWRERDSTLTERGNVDGLLISSGVKIGDLQRGIASAEDAIEAA